MRWPGRPSWRRRRIGGRFRWGMGAATSGSGWRQARPDQGGVFPAVSARHVAGTVAGDGEASRGGRVQPREGGPDLSGGDRRVGIGLVGAALRPRPRRRGAAGGAAPPHRSSPGAAVASGFVPFDATGPRRVVVEHQGRGHRGRRPVDPRHPSRAGGSDGEDAGPMPHRQALALEELCAGEASADGPSITVFMDLDAANGTGGEAGAELAFGPRIGPDALDELLCEGAVRIVGLSDGKPVVTSAKSRRIPPAIRDFVMWRDGGCRAGGCRSTHRLQIHHVVPWSHGGTHHPDNLVTLCLYHHHVVVHRRGHRIEKQATARSVSSYRPTPAIHQADITPNHLVGSVGSRSLDP